MGRHLRLRFAPLLLVGLVGAPVAAAGQTTLPHAVAREVSVRGGRIEGTVTDQSGAAVDGASIVAMGTALAAARTDARGRFTLPLPQGEYVLRATRDGYVSTYREPIRVQSDALLRRYITLTKSGPAEPAVLLAGAAAGPENAAPQTMPVEDSSEQAQTDAAWRLRHLRRTVLRDESPSGSVLATARPARFGDPGALVDWLVMGSARAATSFITETDFKGQLNFLTSSAVPASGLMAPRSEWPRGVAYVVLGAPVGSYGDWALRAATTPGELSSWTLLTEYRARPDRTHSFRTGVAYSAQDYLISQAPLAAASVRRVGGAYLFDRWTLQKDTVLDLGVKVDRYDYLADPTLVSSNLGVKVGVVPHTRFITYASSRMIAPGADQFLPPSASGVWLPPERTFSALRPGSALQPEKVGRYEIGFETDLGEGRVLSLRRFAERSEDQITTLFGLDPVSQVGHYYIASPGDVRVEGWSLGIGGRIVEHVTGNVQYAVMDADWTRAGHLGALRRASPSSIRNGGRRGHDFSASLDADLPASQTHVSLSLRASNEFSAASRGEWLPVVGGRFKIEVRQQLPYQPLRGGELNVLITVRTLMRDLGDEGSLYDELLTVRPPLRLTSGVQMRF